MSENNKSDHLGLLILFNTFFLTLSASLRTEWFLHPVDRASLASKSQTMPGAGIDALGIK